MVIERLGPDAYPGPQAIVERGKRIYEARYKADYEPLHHGKFVAIDIETARQVVKANLGRRADEIFSEFSPAVAAASIAQVHRAEVMTNDGPRAVAVKVLRPGIERRFKADLDAFYFAARKGEAIPGAEASATGGGARTFDLPYTEWGLKQWKE